MLLFASFNGPSDARCWFALGASIVLGVVVGLFLRSAWKGFLGGGAGAALLTLVVLGSARGDMVGLMTTILSPVFGVIGGSVGCCAGAIGKAFGRSKQER